MLPGEDDDADMHSLAAGASPRLRAPGSAFDARTMSPTMRTVHPKARRSLDVDMPESMEPIFGRGSPNPFQPIRGGSDLGHDGQEPYSMAGLTNVQELRRAALMTQGYDPEPMIKACVKVFVTQVQPSYAMPWARGEEARSTGSGFVVEMPPNELTFPSGNGEDGPGGAPAVVSEREVHPGAQAAAPGMRCILTNAHVVEHFSLVQVRCAGSAEKYVAKVLCIGHDVDLAILLVQDDAFWEGLPLVQLGTGLPRLASEVVAVGFPVGGDDVSATRGVVSRILVGGLTDNLCVQIDAAINPGNSGGPVFDSGGKLVGVAFSGLMNANNVGYIIPLPVVHTFLQNFRRHGEYTGKCSDCFEIQSMENLALKRSFGLGGKESGVMISRVPPESNVHGVLQVRDILLELDGVKIANDGTIQLPGTHDLVRVTFSYLVYRAARGHKLRLAVLRNHERHQFIVPAMPQPELLLVCKQPLPKPSYLVVGGLVFVPLMSPYEALLPRRKLDSVLRQPSFEGQQIVVLLMILRAEVNVGYEEQMGLVAEVNGEPIKSLRGLREQVESVSEGTLVFRMDSGEMIVIDAKKCWQNEADIFYTHRIPHRCSNDLL